MKLAPVPRCPHCRSALTQTQERGEVTWWCPTSIAEQGYWLEEDGSRTFGMVGTHGRPALHTKVYKHDGADMNADRVALASAGRWHTGEEDERSVA